MFNITTWDADTRVTLCNVPWDSAYSDTPYFADEAEKSRYFSALPSELLVLDRASYVKFGQPFRAPIPWELASKYNYMVVDNPVYGSFPDRAKLYYFITDVEYLAPETTVMSVQLDVWTTYINECTFDYCDVVKGHVGIANSNSTIYNLPEYLLEKEGLNIGDEYEVVHQEYINFMEDAPWVVFSSSTSITDDAGSVSDPKLKTANGCIVWGIPSGCETYLCTADDFLKLMQGISDYSWVSQGINYITMVPSRMAEGRVYLGEYYGAELYEYSSKRLSGGETVFIDDFFAKFALPERYSHLHKMTMYPYAILEVTMHSGGTMIYKPEGFAIKDEFEFEGTTHKDFLMWQSKNSPSLPSPKMYFYPSSYNAAAGEEQLKYPYTDCSGNDLDGSFSAGEALDTAVIMSDFPQLSIVNNSYNYYLASTAHSTTYAQYMADWSQQLAARGADNAYNVAEVNRFAGETQTRWANDYAANQLALNQANSWVDTGMNAVTSIAGGAAVGGAAGAAMGAGNAAAGFVGNVMNIGAQNNNMMLQQAQTSRMGGLASDTAKYANDANYALADFANKGNYEAAMRGIQAKIEDAKLMQPSVAGQQGGNVFNFVHGMMGVLFKWKRLKPHFMRTVGDFFLRYGYIINRRFVPPSDLRCCTHFTYWQMSMVSVNADIPEVFKDSIRGILRQGTTVWHRPESINKIDLAENKPIERGYYE